ncbi:hypothetical protein CONCODRAFT_147796 [Conidiobolus coronatus NRRL 28638]|uniref:Uncharacterized protein n=1 Tax=Conidiobolus coronatus (strain ATCC 28846 / CBS 209.66 / NRRL 28638) TaxID=796925 RepID=A0A137NQX8_CONC2|nr:hypothetical protein CONCODRAFT_147796 [Conidiobolus coronatus NRRL 28638]|eukprot:KXN65128.1 hypothetical protein CONCODRAFT_147796 [Conidiobolus coronatus NRRL 28638]
MKSIYEKCTNLQVLDICPRDHLWGQEKDTFFKEFFESELFTGNFKINSTLTNLTFNRFLAIKSKAEQYKNFKNLNSIKYLNQAYNNYHRQGQNNDIDMGLWPGYKLIPIYKHVFLDDIELKKIYS